MSLLIFLNVLLFLNSHVNFGKSAVDLSGRVCFWDAMQFASCKQEKYNALNLKHNEYSCTDPCFFEVDCVGSYCYNVAINIVIRNFEVVFEMDRISMVHSRMFCQGNPSSDVRMYDFKLVCNNTFVKENSDIGSLCFQDRHCSSREHLQCYTYKRNWETSPYGFCKCRTGYVEHNRTCLQENLALHSSCQISIQCQDHRSRTDCFYHTDGSRRCQCKSIFLEDKKNCIEANLTLHSKCQSDIQCLDHESFTECRQSPGGKRCLCKFNYLEYEDKCLEVEVSVNQTCIHEVQCNGTVHAPVCYKNRCSCDFGYVQSDEKCIKDALEVASQQGSGSSTYGVLYLAIATGSGLIVGILLSLSVIPIILRKFTWKNSNREEKLNTVSNVKYMASTESIHCANREIYNSIEEFPYMEPKEVSERQEEKQRKSSSVEGQYNHLFESEQIICEEYSKTEVLREEISKNRVSTGSKNFEENNKANEYFTLEKM